MRFESLFKRITSITKLCPTGDPLLYDDSTDWLLEVDNPSVRYFTLCDILGKSETDHEVEQTKENIMSAGVVPAILYAQDKDSFWVDARKFYTA